MCGSVLKVTLENSPFLHFFFLSKMSWLHLMNFVLYHHHMWSNHNELTISQLIIIVWFKLIFLKLICEVNSKIYLIKELQLQQIYWKCVRSENKIKFYRPCLYEGSSTFLLVSIYRYYLHINVYIQSVLLVPVNYCLYADADFKCVSIYRCRL